MLLKLFDAVVGTWAFSELALGLLVRARRERASVRDRGSFFLLWSAIGVGTLLGFRLQHTPHGVIHAPATLLVIGGLVLILSGLLLRWTAILTLGRFFTSNVATHAGQSVVRTGVYRYVRHPAYSSLLISFLGLGLALANWFSLAAVLLPLAVALAYRIHVEEAAMLTAMGPDYADYCASTRRLIPGVY
jgi:protein-S-isoprenylcysteine O-methyltransferase